MMPHFTGLRDDGDCRKAPKVDEGVWGSIPLLGLHQVGVRERQLRARSNSNHRAHRDASARPEGVPIEPGLRILPLIRLATLLDGMKNSMHMQGIVFCHQCMNP